MAADFDLPPVYDIATSKGDLLSGLFQEWLATFVQTLVSYITSNGMFLPPLTTAERNANIPTPKDGQIIFNSTVNRIQAWYSGTWNNL